MQFGPYIVDKQIDSRGTVRVFAAHHESSQQTVLLTVFEPGETPESDWLEHLKTLRGVQHPGILTFANGKRTAEGLLYIVTPLLPPLRLDTPLEREQVLRLAQQLCAALDYAHEQGFAHGALTHPGNLLQRDEQVLIRGFETAITDASAEAVAADIAALAKVLHRAVAGRADSVREVPPQIKVALARAVRGEFLTAGSLYDALSAPGAWRERGARTRRYALIAGLGMAAFAIVGIVLLIVSRQNIRAAQTTPVAVLILPSEPPATPTPEEILPTSTPISPTSSPPPTETSIPTNTPSLSFTLTFTPSPTLTATLTATGTPSPLPSLTLIPASPTLPPTATLYPTLTVTNTPLPAEAQTQPCVALVGDSVTHGGVTYEVPEVGYIVALAHPLAEYVNRQLTAQGLTDLKALDRGVSHTGISTLNHPSYFQTSTYAALRKDHCRFYAIMPWLNDISPDIAAPQAAARHVEALTAMINVLLRDNPYGRIMVFNYYHGATAPFALRTWASGFTPENVITYNNEMENACKFGTLSQLRQVYCVTTNDAFEGMGINHVIGPTTRQALVESLTEPLTEKQNEWLDYYFGKYPDGMLQGDGVHLSVAGKQALSAFIVDLVKKLPPVQL